MSQPVNLRFKRLHICSICWKKFEWTDESQWFGSIDEILYKACSKKCKEAIDENCDTRRSDSQAKT